MWHPIETAPIGKDILVCMGQEMPEEGTEVIQWVDWRDADGGWHIYPQRYDIPFPPSRWMPLPPSPPEWP